MEGDPLADIRAAATVRQVVLGGKLYTVDELLAPFAAPVAAEPVAHPAVLGHDGHEAPQWWHRPEWALPVCCGID